MNTPFICLRCSRQLLRSNRQLRTANFVSLGKLVDRDDGSQAQELERAAADVDKLSAKSPGLKKRQTFAQQYQEQRRPVGVDKVLETLFSSNRAQEQVSQLWRYSRTPKEPQAERVVEHTISNRSIDRRLFELHNMLQRGTSRLEYIWATCLQLLGERDWRLERGLSDDGMRRQHVVFHDILLAICSKHQVLVQDTIVTPRMVIHTYLKHGVMRNWWHRVIWSKLGQLMELRHSAAEKTPEQVKKVKILAQDLSEVWSLFALNFQKPRDEVQNKDNVKDLASRVPPYESLEHRFLRLMDKYPNGAFVSSMAAAAIATLDFLDAESIPCAALLGEFFAELRRGKELDLSITRIWLSEAGIGPETIERILQTLEAQQWRDKHDTPAWKRDELGERKAKRIYAWNEKAIDKRLVEVDIASRRADPEDAVNLWENFVDYMKSEKPKDKDTISRIFAKFLRTFWALRCSNEAIGVWNFMINSGQSPAQMHWTAMLSGCVPARDATSMQAIWRNMLRSNFTPDIGTWTTYIHGLIKLWKWQEGLEALESVGRLWKGKTPTGMLHERRIKQKDTNPLDPNIPNIAPVHAALSALVDIKKPELHATVIAWAEAQNLRLETYTFNILLQPLVRHGTQAQVQSHLQQMAAHNCSPDIITFTIILNGLVSNKDSNFHTLPPETQKSTIISILKDMEDKGLPANARTYTVLLDGLLNPKPWKELKFIGNADTSKTTYNVPAARTILAHMQSRNLHPSPHHYTILISHYFAYKPPDLAAVASLWAGIRHSGQTEMMDDFFYDRIIEGYANHDEIEMALQFLRRVPEEGKRPSWWALYRVLAALERGAEWDLCRELLQDIEDPKGLLRHGQGLFRGKREFYELVDLLREKGVTIGGMEQV